MAVPADDAVPDYRLPATDCRLPTTDCRLPATATGNGYCAAP